MKPAESFIYNLLFTLTKKFPEDIPTILNFSNILWKESTNLTEQEHKAIHDFIEYFSNKIMALN